MIKVQKSAAYWTIGIGIFTLLVLLLCPPHIWRSIESIGSSNSASYGSYGSAGRVIDSKVHESWKSRMSGNNMVLVSDRAETRPSVKKSTKPACLRWHKVKQGQTQWHLAQAYNNRKNKQEWLRGMRWLSGKRSNDASLKVGESVCVRWARTV